MKVLVTGTEGYLGSLLAPTLVTAGTTCSVSTPATTATAGCTTASPQTAQTLRQGHPQLTVEDLDGLRRVVHMAELSNDPLGELVPSHLRRSTTRGSVRLASSRKQAGVERFVYTSSCSVYGVGRRRGRRELADQPADRLRRVQGAGRARRRARWPTTTSRPTFLRNATAFGASPRMRFDIVLNNLAGLAWTTKADHDDQRRHAVAAAGARAGHLRGDRAARWRRRARRCTSQIFNVGANEQNYQVREIAEIVGEVFPGCDVTFGAAGGDNRSYRVSFDKISEQLPGFACGWNARRGRGQLPACSTRSPWTPETFTGRGTPG